MCGCRFRTDCARCARSIGSSWSSDLRGIHASGAIAKVLVASPAPTTPPIARQPPITSDFDPIPRTGRWRSRRGDGVEAVESVPGDGAGDHSHLRRGWVGPDHPENPARAPPSELQAARRASSRSGPRARSSASSVIALWRPQAAARPPPRALAGPGGRPRCVRERNRRERALLAPQAAVTGRDRDRTPPDSADLRPNRRPFPMLNARGRPRTWSIAHR